MTTCVVATGSPSSAEVAVFRWFNDPPRVLGAVTALINPLLRPVGLTVVILVVVVLLFVSRRDVFWTLITHAAGAGILAYLMANALKGGGIAVGLVSGGLVHVVDPWLATRRQRMA